MSSVLKWLVTWVGSEHVRVYFPATGIGPGLAGSRLWAE